MHAFHDNGRSPISPEHTSRQSPRSSRFSGSQLPTHEPPWPGGISTGSERSSDGLDEFALRFIRAKVRQLVGRAGFTESDRPDLVQDFVLNLLERAEKFDAAMASWQGFVVVTCQNHFVTILEHRSAQKRSRDHESGSLNTSPRTGKRGDIGSSLPESQHDRRTGRRTWSHEEAFGVAHDLADVISKFPPRLRELCRRIMSGSSKAAAAKELGMSQPELYEVLGRIRARFEKAGLRGYL
jgi:RNA polymerase sigma-70 factor (ECF subfamily)